MTSQEKKGLLFLREDLERMRTLHQEIGFGILRCSLPLPIERQLFWETVRRHFAAKSPDIVWKMWLTAVGEHESFPGKNEAIRWVGDSDGINEYKKWAKTAFAFLEKHPNLLAVQYSDDGWFEILRTLCSVATSCPDLSSFLDETVMDDDETEDIFKNEFARNDFKSTEDTLKITLLDVRNALTFSLSVLDHLLGVKVVELKINKEDNIAVLNGNPCGLRKLQTIILSLLLGAKGNWISSTEMGKIQPILKGKRIDRWVARLPKSLYGLIEHVQSKGYRLLIP